MKCSVEHEKLVFVSTRMFCLREITIGVISIQQNGKSTQILRNAQSFLLGWPRGVPPVWCWASGRHLALCGVSSFSLTLQVGSSRTVVSHLVCSAHTPDHKGAPIMGVMRRSQFFIWFLLPLVFHLSPPFIGIGFSQDQVTWFQWNGISFMIIVSPLPFILRCGLHLPFLEGFMQSLT